MVKKSIRDWAKWNDEMVRKYHSEGTLFESKNPILRYIERKRLRSIIKLAHISKNDELLDLGCGEGYLLSLLPRIKRTVGADISKVALKRAREVLRGKDYIELIHANAQELKFRDKIFDKVTCSELLEHVPKPSLVMKEIHRVLRDKGLLVVSIPNEKRIRRIMKFIKLFGLAKILHAARKNEHYEWHLHEADLNFLKRISKGYFDILKVKRVPRFLGYRFVISLKKKQARHTKQYGVIKNLINYSFFYLLW